SVAAKADRPSAFLELARIRYDEALAKPAGPDKSLSAAQANAVIDLLLAARKQPPPMPAVYELLADTWVRSSVTPKRDDVTILAEGVQLFPGRLKLTYQTAALCATAGVPEAAHSLVDHGIRIAPDANSRARFEALKKSLPPEPPKTEPPAAAPAAAATPAASAKPAGKTSKK
ncbi:MAG: hypothetical protein Q7S40_27425, partial [Opitutaceae bacterium]|nr:hypothetical protein [Opitutaceae bacterium]